MNACKCMKRQRPGLLMGNFFIGLSPDGSPICIFCDTPLVTCEFRFKSQLNELITGLYSSPELALWTSSHRQD